MSEIKLYIFPILLLVFSCTTNHRDVQLANIPYNPTPQKISTPKGFPQIEEPADNLATVEGITLGRALFYDPILSVDSSIACSFCHLPQFSFTDRHAKSRGVKGTVVKRSSPSLINMGMIRNGFFWDGRVHSLEEQALLPIEDPLEMQASWSDIEQRLRAHPDYPTMFRRAFGIEHHNELNRDLVVKAIAQFERTLVSSGTSKYNRVQLGLDTFTFDEAMGFDLFFDVSPQVKDAECGNCHNAPLFTNHVFSNNGIEAAASYEDFPDLGLGAITNDKYDNGKFKVPTLYNIALTSPYMHDGRFRTLKEVLAHYNRGGQQSPTIDPLIRPLGLTELEQEQIIAFLHTLTDTVFLKEPMFQNPFL